MSQDLNEDQQKLLLELAAIAIREAQGTSTDDDEQRAETILETLKLGREDALRLAKQTALHRYK